MAPTVKCSCCKTHFLQHYKVSKLNYFAKQKNKRKNKNGEKV